MSEFMIEYITRFKVRFEEEVKKLEVNILDHPSIHELQLTRARNVIEAADAILEMGPNAVQIDQEKFENWRSVLLSNNASYNKTLREIKDGTIKSTKVVRQKPQSRSR